MKQRYQPLYDKSDARQTAIVTKVAICGSAHTGKSELLHALMNDPFKDDAPGTVGCELHTQVAGPVEFQFWDMSGSELSQRLWGQYLRGAAQVLLVYSKTSPASFDDLEEHLEQIRRVSPQAKITLVATHADLQDKEILFRMKALNFATTHGLRYFEVSAKTQAHIDSLKSHMVREAIPVKIPEDPEQVKLKNEARQKIQRFRGLAYDQQNTTCATAIRSIANILLEGLEQDNPESFFAEHQALLQDQLQNLQYTQSSLLSSSLNAIMTSLAFLGGAVPGFYDSMKQNYKLKGSHFLFSTRGEKQQAQEMIHHTLAIVSKKSTKG